MIITIPEDYEGLLPMADGKVLPGKVSFAEYMDESVWSQTFWRTDGKEILERATRMRRLLAAEPGTKVELQLQDWEILCKRIGLPDVPQPHKSAVPIIWHFSTAVYGADQE